MKAGTKPKLLGIAASLRNARWGAGNRALSNALEQFENAEQLTAFLAEQSSLHLENFLQAGRKAGKDFLEIYANLRKLSGDAGLSNSEVALAAALWAAHAGGLEIDHLSLAEHFAPSGELRREAVLREKLLAADGLLISGPVYFGDRGSLAESLLDWIARDAELREALAGRLYGGIAVGAKRNGGQETTLIYQMLDMLKLAFLAVGNDSETTSQYGGTGLAGDVGTMHKDTYGINTSMGTGRRMARVLPYLNTPVLLSAPPRVLFLLLQEVDGTAQQGIERLLAEHKGGLAATVLDVASERIQRCIACDICPTHIDVDEEYRCIIQSRNDAMGILHEALLHHDLIIPVAACARDRTREVSHYQSFIERTRYLRRGDYVWSDLLVAPLVFEELGTQSTVPLRMLTSFLRHHTVMAQPMTAYLQDARVINEKAVSEQFAWTLRQARRLAAGRLASAQADRETKYNPVGYVLSANKDLEDERMQRRNKMVQSRKLRLQEDAEKRLGQLGPSS